LRAGLPNEHKKVHLLPVAGGLPRPLVAADVEQGMPSWSPDGRKLTFGDVPPVFGYPEGGEVVRAYDLSTNMLSSIPGSAGLWTSRWSPDGRFISALTIALNEGQRLRLYDVARGVWRSTEADHVNAPTWSPDSKYIYYDTEGMHRSLRRLRIEDGKVEELADMSGVPVAHYGWSGLALDGSPMVLAEKYDTEIYAFTVERR
jgi:Tol biopolymer transport system component